MAVDGTALNTSVLAQVSEPNVTFERDELQKKLDKRDIDLMRKEKELHKCEMEVFRLQKEAKLSASENQNLRDRNETLQQSLMNARLLSQNARDEAANAFNQNRIRELESALSAAIHKIKKGELELNNWQNKWKDAYKLFVHPAGTFLGSQIQIVSTVTDTILAPEVEILPPPPFAVHSEASFATSAFIDHTSIVTDTAADGTTSTSRIRPEIVSMIFDGTSGITLEQIENQYGTLREAQIASSPTFDDTSIDLSNDFAFETLDQGKHD